MKKEKIIHKKLILIGVFTLLSVMQIGYSQIKKIPPKKIKLPGPQSVKVISPNGGEIWKAGEVRSIKWNTLAHFEIKTVTIRYSTDLGTTFIHIVNLPGNPGSYDWTIPNISSINCIIMVEVRGDGPHRMHDMSDRPFTIVRDTTPPSVRVTSPNGGESWKIGETKSITWEASDDVGVNNVDILFTTDNKSRWMYIDKGVNNTGHYNWIVPDFTQRWNNLPSCFIRIIAHDNVGNIGTDDSDDKFAITRIGAFLPDLIIDGFSFLKPSYKKGKIEAKISVTVKNIGPKRAGYSRATVAINAPYRSRGVIRRMEIPPLAPKESFSFSFSYSFTSSGKYELCATADTRRYVSEQDEKNNSLCKEINIPPIILKKIKK